MKKRNKIVTSVTIDPADKKKADELHINYSEAFDRGLKWMLTIKDEDSERKRRIMEQENKVKRLKTQMKFGEDLFKAVSAIKLEYTEIMNSGDNINDNQYMVELIKLEAMKLDIPSKFLKNLFNDVLLGKTNKNEVESFKMEDIISSK